MRTDRHTTELTDANVPERRKGRKEKNKGRMNKERETQRNEGREE